MPGGGGRQPRSWKDALFLLYRRGGEMPARELFGAGFDGRQMQALSRRGYKGTESRGAGDDLVVWYTLTDAGRMFARHLLGDDGDE